MATETHRSYCALCVSRCGCVCTVTDGVLVRVEADPDHPSGGSVCIKAKAAPEAVGAPDRLLQPMRRSRPKGDPDPGWRPISWDEALDLTVAAMRAATARHGPTGLAFGVATPSGTAVADSFAWIHRLAHASGSPNLVFATENCNWHRDHAPADTFGAGIGMPDYERTGCILLWGFNPAVTWPAHAAAIRRAQKRGARLIVVDPRRAGLAAAADLWLRPKPGADGALALGLANVLIETERYDHNFLANWSDAPFLATDDGRLLSEADLHPGGDPLRPLAWNPATDAAQPCPPRQPNAGPQTRLALRGRYTVATPAGPVACRPVFDRLAERCRDWPPGRVAEVAGIPAGQVEAAAELIADHLPLSFYTWTGTAQHGNASQTGRAIAALYGLTGCLDAPGGNVWFAKPPLADVAGFDWVSPEQRATTLGYRERPLGPPRQGWITTRDLFQAITKADPYPVSCLVAFGGNFLVSKPETRLSDAALRQLDFFALAELAETPTARYADLLLPVCTAWEREGLQAGFLIGAAAEAHVQLRPAVVAPRGESRPDTWIVFELAKRLGLAERFFGGDPEAALAAQLAPAGLTPAQLRAAPGGLDLDLVTPYRKYRLAGFATPSGRLEFHSARLRDAGLDPLPGELGATAAPDPGYPLTLTTAKWPQYCHSQQRNLPSLRRRMPEPLVELHPDTAAALGIGENDWLRVETRTGAMPARARFDRHLAPETVCAQYGWWQYPDGAGDANRLFDGECFDPVSGANCLRAAQCRIVRLT